MCQLRVEYERALYHVTSRGSGVFGKDKTLATYEKRINEMERFHSARRPGSRFSRILLTAARDREKTRRI